MTEERNNTTRTGDWLSHLLGYAFGMNFLFGSVSVLNTLELSFFFNYPRTINISLIDSRLDLLIWVVSAASLSALTIWFSYGRTKRTLQIGIALFAMFLSPILLVISQPTFLHTAILYVLFVLTAVEFALLAFKKISPDAKYHPARPSLVLIYLLASLIVIETSSALYFVIRSFGGTTQIGLIDAGIELQLSYAAYGLIPWLYVAFLFSWLWVPLALRLGSRSSGLSRVFSGLGQTSAGSAGSDEAVPASRLDRVLDPRLILAVTVAVFIGFYVYFQNPPWLVGTDAYWRYHGPLMNMNNMRGFAGFLQALSERHPMPLAILYAVQLIFHTSAFEVVKYTPLVLVVGLGFATWWFLGAGKRMDFGIIVFLMGVLSVTTTVGFYSGILANWIAVLCWVVFFAYVALMASSKLRVVDFMVLTLLSTLILLLHPWTWGVFAAAVFIAAVLGLVSERRKAARLAGSLLLVVLVDAVFALLSITILSHSQGWRVMEALDIYAIPINNPSILLFFWNALTRLTEIWAPFFSPLYLALSILGVFCLQKSDLTSWRRYLIWGWLCVSAIGSVLVAPISFDPARPTETESQLWRMLFLTPFQLTVPFGIAWILQLANRMRRRGNAGETQTPSGTWVGPFWLGILLSMGGVLAFAPAWGRFLVLVVSLPLLTAVFLVRSGISESEFLTGGLLLWFLLVVLNSTMRPLSLLLLDPHNYYPID